jgi:mannose-6-phosphate isomerase
MSTALYPLKFAPVYKDIIWGGDNILRRYGRTAPMSRVAESWELTCRPDGMGKVTNGALAGRSFESLISEYGGKLLGARSLKLYGERFPLLLKLIDANDRLSVQVHPDDAYARAHGEDNGKTEMWYIIDAKPGAKLVYGLRRGVTKDIFKKAVEDGASAGTLREVPVSRGDCFYIPAGTVHAILSGILIAEIQQNSNTTYRIYDWDRVGKDGRGRELHVAKALDVINFGAQPQPGAASAFSPELPADGCRARALISTEFFSVDELNIGGEYTGAASGSFEALMNIEGDGEISWSAGCEPIAPGETLLVPACVGGYCLRGRMRVLRSRI